LKAGKVKGLNPGQPFRSNATRIVAARLDELRGLAPDALEPSGEVAQHEMRIAAKRLRYVLEITGPCLGLAADAAQAVAKDLQGVLGDIHDCDVMGPKADGIESVEALLRTRRELLHARFRELWKSEGAQGALGRLGDFLSDGDGKPPPAG
jgi:CHAD domain-containing protein